MKDLTVIDLSDVELDRPVSRIGSTVEVKESLAIETEPVEDRVAINIDRAREFNRTSIPPPSY